MSHERYDVFVSFSSADRDVVREIVGLLRRDYDLHAFFDEDCLRPGRTWQDELEYAIAHSDAMAVFFGPNGGGPWRDMESQLGLIKAVHSDDFCLIPVLLPGVSPEALQGRFLSARHCIRFTANGDSNALDRLGGAIRGRAPENTSESLLPDEPAPYPGLRPLQPADRAFFFGRADETNSLLERLRSRRVVTIGGASGAGKSSLIRAGVLPALRADDRRLLHALDLDRVLLMTPSDRPLREWRRGLQRCALRLRKVI